MTKSHDNQQTSQNAVDWLSFDTDRSKLILKVTRKGAKILNDFCNTPPSHPKDEDLLWLVVALSQQELHQPDEFNRSLPIEFQKLITKRKDLVERLLNTPILFYWLSMKGPKLGGLLSQDSVATVSSALRIQAVVDVADKETLVKCKNPLLAKATELKENKKFSKSKVIIRGLKYIESAIPAAKSSSKSADEKAIEVEAANEVNANSVPPTPVLPLPSLADILVNFHNLTLEGNIGELELRCLNFAKQLESVLLRTDNEEKTTQQPQRDQNYFRKTAYVYTFAQTQERSSEFLLADQHYSTQERIQLITFLFEILKKISIDVDEVSYYNARQKAIACIAQQVQKIHDENNLAIVKDVLLLPENFKELQSFFDNDFTDKSTHPVRDIYIKLASSELYDTLNTANRKKDWGDIIRTCLIDQHKNQWPIIDKECPQCFTNFRADFNIEADPMPSEWTKILYFAKCDEAREILKIADGKGGRRARQNFLKNNHEISQRHNFFTWIAARWSKNERYYLPQNPDPTQKNSWDETLKYSGIIGWNRRRKYLNENPDIAKNNYLFLFNWITAFWTDKKYYLLALDSTAKPQLLDDATVVQATEVARPLSSPAQVTQALIRANSLSVVGPHPAAEEIEEGSEQINRQVIPVEQQNDLGTLSTNNSSAQVVKTSLSLR